MAAEDSHGTTLIDVAAKTPPSRHEDWLVLGNGSRLHRVYNLSWFGGWWDVECMGDGYAVCGIGGTFSVPGLFSRMGMPRCARCCDRLGIPRGNGNTLNAGIEERRNHER